MRREAKLYMNKVASQLTDSSCDIFSYRTSTGHFQSNRRTIGTDFSSNFVKSEAIYTMSANFLGSIFSY